MFPFWKNCTSFTLVECRLETGRTHQVRIHLGEAETPLCGERIYDRPLHGKPSGGRQWISSARLARRLSGLSSPHHGQMDDLDSANAV